MFFRLKRRILIVLCLSVSLYLLFRPELWSSKRQKYAIVQYATERQYLCNALINVHRLIELGTLADLVVLLPDHLLKANPRSPTGRIVGSLLQQHAKLVPFIESSTTATNDRGSIYDDSLYKLQVANLLQYERIIYFDNDGLVLENPDHLFNSITTDLALADAYYTANEDNIVSSAFMVISPSQKLDRLLQSLIQSKSPNDYDMEIINQAYNMEGVLTTTLFPYERYLLLTGIFRTPLARDKFLKGSSSRGTATTPAKVPEQDEAWNAKRVFQAASYIHFSDSPIPKPWVDDRGALLAQHGPKCMSLACDEPEIWKNVYRMFKDEMRDLCPSPKELDL